MAYDITKTNGSPLVSVADATINTSHTSLTLIGKNYAGYGEYLNENFVKLTENFSNTTAPANPLEGQLWWHSTDKVLSVRSGPDWAAVSGAKSSATTPSTAKTGDLWWDTSVEKLKVYDGAAWVIVGPVTNTVDTGVTGTTINDDAAGTHEAVVVNVDGTPIAVFSKDVEYTSADMTISPAAGFTTIKPGLNLSTVGGLSFNGTITNSTQLGGVAAANYMRTDAATTNSVSVKVTGANGFMVGANEALKLSSSGNNSTIANTVAGGNITVMVGATTAISISGSDGRCTVVADPTAPLGIATKAFVESAVATGISGISGDVLLANGSVTIKGVLLPDGDSTRNLGSGAAKFNTIYATTFSGTASSAQYADLAERFEADAAYIPGTVVELGGVKEITAVGEDLSEDVFGVISSKAAYLMNAGAGSDSTHPAVAVQGRVPVRVIGKVKKGDRLVSAGNGLARAAARSELTSFNVIGRALHSKNTTEEGMVEAVVQLNS